MDLRAGDTEEPASPAGNTLEQRDSPTETAQKTIERDSDHQRDALGTRKADHFGNKFAENHVRRAQQCESAGKSNAVQHNDGVRAHIVRPDLLQETRQNALAQGTDGQAGKRDAELYAGNDARQFTEKLLNDFGAHIAAHNKLPDARKAHGDERKFRSGEKAVESEENHHANELEANHATERP